jgi:hypothetical protein
MNHHTHDKGDVAMVEVMSDLVCQGFKICLPVSTHLPFDLIAVHNETGELLRIQVKYRAVGKGRIEVNLRTQSVGAGKCSYKSIVPGWVDAWAVYCPDTKSVYYIGADELLKVSRFTLRIAPTGNGQSKGIRLARGYRNPERLLVAK